MHHPTCQQRRSLSCRNMSFEESSFVYFKRIIFPLFQKSTHTQNNRWSCLSKQNWKNYDNEYCITCRCSFNCRITVDGNICRSNLSDLFFSFFNWCVLSTKTFAKFYINEKLIENVQLEKGIRELDIKYILVLLLLHF